MKRLLLAGLILAAPFTAGCQCGESEPPPEESDPPPHVDRSIPPDILDVEIPSFPPIGPKTTLTAHVTDDRGLRSVGVEFLNLTEYDVSGTKVDVKFNGHDLGEGFGTAVVRATDVDGNHTDLGMYGIAVDLSPPTAELLDTVVRRGDGSDVWIWVGDAFVLGAVTVEFGGASQSYEFEKGYPPTFGEDWDQSLVNFSTLDFPEGTGAFHIAVKDAAGNASEFDFDLRLDGTAPAVDITSPSSGDAVSGVFHVHATAADDTGGPVWISLALGGTPIGTFAGPDADVDIDTSDYAPGNLVLTATALDDAGNESDPIEVPLVLN